MFTKVVISYSIRLVNLLIFFLCLMISTNIMAETIASNTDIKKPLRLGLIPHLSTKLLLQKYGPLINYLEKELQRPVIVNTAPNFRTFIERVIKGDFDIYLTAPSMAAYHEKHNNHWRLAKFSQKIQGAIVVTNNSPYQTIGDLKGKIIAAPDVLAVVTALGEITLMESGVYPEKDAQLIYTPSHNNALQSVVEDKSDASIMGYNIYKIITSRSQLRQPTRILAKTKKIPHMMFMSPENESQLEKDEYKDILLNFTADGKGKAFFEGIPFINIETITDEDMKSLEGLLKILEQRLHE